MDHAEDSCWRGPQRSLAAHLENSTTSLRQAVDSALVLAKVLAHHRMQEVFDTLVYLLCGFTGLLVPWPLSPGDLRDQAYDYASNSANVSAFAASSSSLSSSSSSALASSTATAVTVERRGSSNDGDFDDDAEYYGAEDDSEFDDEDDENDDDYEYDEDEDEDDEEYDDDDYDDEDDDDDGSYDDDDDDDDDDDGGGDFEAIGRDGESSTSATAALRRQYLGSPLVAPSINAQVTLLRDFVTAPAARMAAVAVFGLANRLGSAMRAGWQPLLRIVFRMRDLHLLDPGK